MPRVRARGWVAAPVAETFAFFDDPSNLARLTPPPVRISVLRFGPTPPRPGTEIEFSYGLGPIRRSWLVRYLDRVADELIVDETVRGPLARFHHRHLFRSARRGTWVVDEIDYHVGPDGLPGALLDFVAGLAMRAAFVYRHALARWLLQGR
jgi:ligand-binding SRPBCC domain-containing protein